MSDSPENPDDDVLAAEFALRLLDADEARAAQRRALSDRAFARRVAVWNAHFSDLAEDVAPETPDTAAKRALMERLFDDAPRTAERPVARGLVPAFWRWIGLAAAAAACVFAAIAFVPMADEGPVYVTEVVSDDGSFRYLAVIDTTRESIRLIRTDGQPPAEGSMELWGHGPDEPPVSFGVIPADTRVTVAVPDILRRDADQLTIAVSNEPEGGSPTGQPTGAVLAIGESTDL